MPGFYPALAQELDARITLGPVTLQAIALPGHTTDMTGLLIADRALIGRRLAVCRRHRAAGSPVRVAVAELAIEDPSEFAARLLSEMPPRPANYEAIIAVNVGAHPFDPELETGGNSCSAR
jgi:hypothetical protein